MLVSCWSVKGGAGTTVTAACLAVTAVASGARETLLVDLAGDIPAVLGVEDPATAGVLDWIGEVAAAGARGPSRALGAPGAIAALEVRVDEHLSILPWGATRAGELPLWAVDPLIERLRGDGRLVIVDAGTVSPAGDDGIRHRFIRAADRSILVTRACYLAMRHVARSELTPDETIVVTEPGRSLGIADVSSVVGAPVVAEVALDPQVARVVDAGLLCSRLPRAVGRSLHAVLEG